MDSIDSMLKLCCSNVPCVKALVLLLAAQWCFTAGQAGLQPPTVKRPGGAAAASADGASCSSSGSVIPALYDVPKRVSGGAGAGADMLSCDAPSTSYPTSSFEDDWDVLGACMTTAQEMEACVDAVVSPAWPKIYTGHENPLAGWPWQLAARSICRLQQLMVPQSRGFRNLRRSGIRVITVYNDVCSNDLFARPLLD